MRLLRRENGLDLALSFLWKKKSCPQSSDRIRMYRTAILRLPEGSLSCRNQQDRKARGIKLLSVRSSLKQPAERPCAYQGDNLAKGRVRQSHESLQEKLPDAGYQVLNWAINQKAYLNGPETVHT